MSGRKQRIVYCSSHYGAGATNISQFILAPKTQIPCPLILFLKHISFIFQPHFFKNIIPCVAVFIFCLMLEVQHSVLSVNQHPNKHLYFVLYDIIAWLAACMICYNTLSSRLYRKESRIPLSLPQPRSAHVMNEQMYSVHCTPCLYQDQDITTVSPNTLTSILWVSHLNIPRASGLNTCPLCPLECRF